MTKNSICDALAHGLDERAIHDVVLITALFAFMNRLADGTGVTIQDNRRAFAIELFGHDAVKPLRLGSKFLIVLNRVRAHEPVLLNNVRAGCWRWCVTSLYHLHLP